MAGGADNIVTIYYQKGRTVVLDYSLGNLDTLTTTLFIHFPWEITISVALLVSKKKIIIGDLREKTANFLKLGKDGNHSSSDTLE